MLKKPCGWLGLIALVTMKLPPTEPLFMPLIGIRIEAIKDVGDSLRRSFPDEKKQEQRGAKKLPATR